jgi:SAM-dependent methyltransferase
VRDPGFEARYRQDPDPFGVHTRWYERRKLACLGAVLAQERYALAWDAACGVGQGTLLLADRCDSVVASDASARAVELTGELTGEVLTDRVTTLVSALPAVPSAAVEADLVVLAEVLYYLPADDRAALARAVAAMPRAREVAAVSWRHRAEDTWVSGTESLDELGSGLTEHDWREHLCLHEPDFEIRTWRRS